MNLIGLSEVRWEGQGELQSGEVTQELSRRERTGSEL